jgi:SWI/SNF-related matrix-associated actin-dependent regulator of chromatin subfamily B member 1
MTTNEPSDVAQPVPDPPVQQATQQDSPLAHRIDASADREAAIQEGKDKAKAIMAASGLDVAQGEPAAAVNGDTNPSQRPSSPAQEKIVNGESSSRKRSRSGSRITKVPRADEHGVYSIESDVDKFRLIKMMEKDSDFAQSLSVEVVDIDKLINEKNAEKRFYEEMNRAKVENPASVFGPGFRGYGNGDTNIPRRGPPPHMLMYPAHKVRLGKRRARRQPYISRTDMADQADLGEELVPIRLDIEHDKLKLRDTFTWNLHDYVTSTDIFAEGLVEDFNVPHEAHGLITRQVAQRIKDQIIEYHPHVFINDPALVDGIPYFSYKNDEMRIVIKLNITIGTHTLVDQFEWEINNPLNNAEEFARVMARDLALSGEFTTAIAHQIREQTQMFTKSLYIINHPFDGRLIEDADVRDNFLPSPIPSVFRPVQAAKDYTPYLYELSESDLQREELSILRDQRRQKRSVTRRGGPALPDLKDREHTIRSLVVSSVLPGAAESLETARLFKLSRSSTRANRGNRTGVDLDSDESESEESDIEVETMPQIVATSRGRIIRNAANAAQQAMRANLGGARSATPEVAQIQHQHQHHEPRVSIRQPSRFEPRDESDSESPSLIVKLKLPKDIFRQWVHNPKLRLDRLGDAKRTNTPRGSHTPSAIHASLPRKESDTPSTLKAEIPSQPQQWTYEADGRVPVSSAPEPGTAVSTPSQSFYYLISNPFAATPSPSMVRSRPRQTTRQVPERQLHRPNEVLPHRPGNPRAC